MARPKVHVFVGRPLCGVQSSTAWLCADQCCERCSSVVAKMYAVVKLLNDGNAEEATKRAGAIVLSLTSKMKGKE